MEIAFQGVLCLQEEDILRGIGRISGVDKPLGTAYCYGHHALAAKLLWQSWLKSNS